MPSTAATCIIASGPFSSPVGNPSLPSGTPGWSMPLRSQPMAASAALLQLMMWPLACIMPTGRVVDTRSRSSRTQRRLSK